MRPDLESLYRQTKNSVAFIDESYETRGDSTFYILAIALVEPRRLQDVRERLRLLNGGHALHASELYSAKQFDLLRTGIGLVAQDHDNADLVVTSPLLPDDSSGEIARQNCLRLALVAIQAEFDTDLFVLDSRNLRDADESDRRTMRDLRKSGELRRATNLRHLWPSEEILLSLPDLIAWSYRQVITKDDTQWFDPLAESVAVTIVDVE